MWTAAFNKIMSHFNRQILNGRYIKPFGLIHNLKAGYSIKIKFVPIDFASILKTEISHSVTRNARLIYQPLRRYCPYNNIIKSLGIFSQQKTYSTFCYQTSVPLKCW